MLAPYAFVKPHAPQTCPQRVCHPHAPGHPVCQNPGCPGRDENNGAGRPAYIQTRRHAAAEEYAQIPLGHIPIDAVAHKPVFMCDDCAEASEAHALFCTHPAPQLPACPKCAAGADQVCVRKDGITALGFNHADRPGMVYDRCTHAHRADCPIFTDCPCTSDDQAPQRPPHPATIPENQPDISRLLFDPAYAQAMLLDHGIHWWQVRRCDSRYTQDNKPCLWAEIADLDDAGHIRYDDDGHETRREVVIVIELPPPGQIGPPRPALPPADAEPNG